MLQHYHLSELDSLCFGTQRFVCQNTVAQEEKIRIFVLSATTAALKKVIKIVKHRMVIAQLAI